MDNKFEKRHLAKKSENITEWYQDVILQSGLADYSDVKGCMIFRPAGFALWEETQRVLDSWFKADGVQNVYFPLFIPYSLLQQEKQHLEGFSPELAVVDYAGGEKLVEPYVVRPTSETIIYKTFARWIHSHRDLPMKVNQWCNVVRWEKRTYLFLRTTEFLWQEGHTVHQTSEQAVAMARQALDWYKKFYEEYFAISVYAGVKSEHEKFAGAKTTYSIELVMPDGKALQGATSHDLADNFSRVFDIKFLNDRGENEHPFQTSWGLSTRSIGGLILSHGDDAGLVIPPKIAPTQVVIIALADKDDKEQEAIITYAKNLAEQLAKKQIRYAIDTQTQRSLGFRINDWELKGIPVRIEIGKREVVNKQGLLVRRDTFEKLQVPEKNIPQQTRKLLKTIQQSLLANSKALKEKLTVEVKDYNQFKTLLSEQKHFVRAFWCEQDTCEQHIKQETKATTRVLELDEQTEKHSGSCVYCGKPAHHRWLFAQSY